MSRPRKPGLFYFRCMNKYLIVGLGNIGAEYAHTRHNIGFDVLNAFAQKQAISFHNGRLADLCEARLKGRAVFCIKPTTYMNLSGKAVKYWMDKEQIALENILVIVDEVALPLDKLRLRGSGSAGGHNGLKSIQELLGSENYPKLRFGIGNEYPKGMQVDYVLGAWFPEQQALVQKKIGVCVEVIESFVLRGIDATMNEFNKMSITL
jgi:peptidyl-tRNA hydrolase, PTH1 family